MWWWPWSMAILWNRTNISNNMLFSNLSQGPLFFVPCDIGYASLGAINAIKQASLCVGYHTQAIVFAHWELLYLHSAFVICFPLCFVCLFAALFMGSHVSCLVKGWERVDKRQKFKTRQRICSWMAENLTSRVHATICKRQKMRPKTDI